MAIEQKHRRLIVLDFDHTLFNTTKFVAAWKTRFAEEFGIDERTFVAARNETKHMNTVIDIDHFIEALPVADKKSLHDAVHTLIKKEVSTCIFSDVASFLERHHDQFDIIIATHGDDELQGEKIHHAGLPAYIGQEISTQPKSKVLIPYVEQYDEVHVIEDKAKNIDEIKQALPSVITYHLKRPEDCAYCHVQTACDCTDQTIKNLDLSIE